MNSDQTRPLSEHDAKVAVARAFDEMNNPQAAAPRARLENTAAQHPLWLLLAATALGYVAGMALPMSDRERENVGPVGDRLAAQAKVTADDLIDDAKKAVTNAVVRALGSGKR